MRKFGSVKITISRVFFYSHLTALTLFGLASAYGNFAAKEFVPGGVLIAANILLILAIRIYALPNWLASITTLRNLKIITLSASILALLFSYSHASAYFDLRPDFLRYPGVRNLRAAAFIDLGAFAIAFLVNLIAVLSVRRSAESE